MSVSHGHSTIGRIEYGGCEEDKQKEIVSHQLDVLIRLRRIYNFLLFHAIILSVLDVHGLYFTLLHYFWD